MRKTIVCFVWVVLAVLIAGTPGRTETPPPKVNGILPGFQLPIPENPALRRYLGIDGKGFFRIQQVKAKAVVIEIFSMYCPYCQREAPRMNQLYQEIESNPDLKGAIKIIGIGAGNSPFEVGIFRDKYHIAFPLFSDNDFSVYRCLGETRTPYFIVVAVAPGHDNKVIYSKLGGIKDHEAFLSVIRSRAGIR